MASRFRSWSRRRKSDGTARWWPVWFTVMCCALLVPVVNRLPRYETVLKHNVRVYTRVSADQWAMEDDEDGRFLYHACDDFPNETVIWAGYVADHAVWEERGACKSIRGADARYGERGFFWSRDENYNARRID